MKPILKLQDASKIYRQGGVKTVGIEAVNLEIYPHDFVAITGRSGCGKSTLLNILGCMDELTSGSYFFDGEDITRLKSRAGAALRNEKIGYVFQAFNLVNEISALENVCMPLGYAGVSKRERDAVAHELLARVGMAEKANKRPVNLSGGEQQRVAIARALVNEPKILLADEPTSALDVTTQAQIVRQMMELRDDFGTGIIIVTHNIGVAAYMADQLIVMHHGKVVDHGTREEVLNNPTSDYTKKLLDAVPEMEGKRYV